MCPRDPVVPWSRGPVWLTSGPVSRPQPGLGWGSQDPESVARKPLSVPPRGPMVPWSRLAHVWPRASSPAWLRLGVPGSRIGGPVDPLGVLAWSCGPVVPSGFRLAPCLDSHIHTLAHFQIFTRSHSHTLRLSHPHILTLSLCRLFAQTFTHPSAQTPKRLPHPPTHSRALRHHTCLL